MVPITEVLMPFPGAPASRILENHLVVPVVYLTAEQLFCGLDDITVAYNGAEDIVSQFVRDPELSWQPG